MPMECSMGWPPGRIQEGSAILCEKLQETTPHTMTMLQSIMSACQSERDRCHALVTIVERSVARLGQLPPTMEPPWPGDLTPTEHANALKSHNAQQAKCNRHHCNFELAAALARGANTTTLPASCERQNSHKGQGSASTSQTSQRHRMTTHASLRLHLNHTHQARKTAST